MLALSA